MGFLPLGSIPDISSIAVNADGYVPCLANGPPDGSGNPTPTAHCDLKPTDPGANPTDAPAIQGFAAQLGFRLPNMVISPFTRKHYVSHVPMDHTAVIKFVENRFIGPSAHLTNRDAAQPDLLDFFDFTNVPWATPPAASSIPIPPAVGSTCTPTTM
jgi:phospholipase C